MKNVRMIPAVLGGALLFSCGSGLLSDMSRTLDEPVICTPATSSFVHENSVDVSWPSDPGADRYVLERAADAHAPAFSVVYEGSSTSYRDVNCTDQGRYLYCLTKVRGTKSFGPSPAGLGIASAVCGDAQEPDNSEGLAKPLESRFAANLYYYSTIFQQNNAPLVEEDADWYTVTVPANSTANIVVTQTQPELQGGSSNTWMRFYLKGQFEEEIVDSHPIAVANYANARTAFLFKNLPIPSCFPVNGGGSMINYEIFPLQHHGKLEGAAMRVGKVIALPFILLLPLGCPAPVGENAGITEPPGGVVAEESDLFIAQGDGSYLFSTSDPAYWGPYGFTVWALPCPSQPTFTIRDVILTKHTGNTLARLWDRILPIRYEQCVP